MRMRMSFTLASNSSLSNFCIEIRAEMLTMGTSFILMRNLLTLYTALKLMPFNLKIP
jgi:hypothetical protein